MSNLKAKKDLLAELNKDLLKANLKINNYT